MNIKFNAIVILNCVTQQQTMGQLGFPWQLRPCFLCDFVTLLALKNLALSNAFLQKKIRSLKPQMFTSCRSYYMLIDKNKIFRRLTAKVYNIMCSILER